MAGVAPIDTVARLVETFDRNRDASHSERYNETWVGDATKAPGAFPASASDSGRVALSSLFAFPGCLV